MIRVCVAGVTGWVGRALAPAVLEAPDLELTGAVSPSRAGARVSDVLGRSGTDVRVSGSVDEALESECDVLVDYTRPDVVKANVLSGIDRGVHVVVGTSGLTDRDYQDVDGAARAAGVGVLAAGNFAISAVLLQRFAMEAARHMPSWEVIDYAGAGKVDAPSGTVRELVARLADVGPSHEEVPVERTVGEKATRGAALDGTRVHAVRLPGFVIGAEVVFGRAGERLSLRYEAGSDPAPYIDGTLLAVRRVGDEVGLRRGLDHVLDLRPPGPSPGGG